MAKLLKVFDCDGVKRGELTREQVREWFKPDQIEYVDGQSAVRIIASSNCRSSASLTVDDTEALVDGVSTMSARRRERLAGWKVIPDHHAHAG
jgi:hypothetical protein